MWPGFGGFLSLVQQLRIRRVSHSGHACERRGFRTPYRRVVIGSDEESAVDRPNLENLWVFSCICSHFQIARRFEFPSIPSNNEDFGRNATFDLKTKVVSLSWPTQFGLSPPTGSWIVAQTEPRRAGGQPSCRFLLAFEARRGERWKYVHPRDNTG